MVVKVTRIGGQPALSNERPSRTIPFPKSHIRRTSSELQFSQEMLDAEVREICMFERLISGLRIKSSECTQKLPSLSVADRQLIEQQTKATIEKMIQQRNGKLQGNSAFSQSSSVLSKTSICNIFVKTSRRGSSLLEDQYGFLLDPSTESDMENDDDSDEGGDVFDLDL